MTENKMMSDLVMSLGPLDVTLNRIEDVNISDHKIIDFEIKINWCVHKLVVIKGWRGELQLSINLILFVINNQYWLKNKKLYVYK